MNWDAIGAIGEIVGAAAVVISVIYLARQIHRQTDESKIAATRELSAHYDELVSLVMNNEKLLSIYAKGIQDYDSLEGDDRVRMSFYFIRAFRMMEQWYIHRTREKVDEIYFSSTKFAERKFVSFPGVRQWWSTSSDLFGPGFCEYVENEIAETDEIEYQSSFSAGDETAT